MKNPSFPVQMTPGRWGSIAALSPSDALAKICVLAACAVDDNDPDSVAREAIAIFAGQILAWADTHSITTLKGELLSVIDKVAGFDREAALEEERRAEANDNLPGAPAKSVA